MWFSFFKNQLLTSVPFSRWKISLLDEARALYISCFVFCRTKGVFLEITMHLTAVVLILSVTSIVKGNLRFRSVGRDSWQRHKEIWVSSWKKKKKQPQLFFSLRGHKVPGFNIWLLWIFRVCFLFFILWCQHADVPFFLSQRLGMQRRVQHRKWVLWEAREVQVLNDLRFLCRFYFTSGEANGFWRNTITIQPSESVFWRLYYVKSAAKSVLCLNSKKHCYPDR